MSLPHDVKPYRALYMTNLAFGWCLLGRHDDYMDISRSSGSGGRSWPLQAQLAEAANISPPTRALRGREQQPVLSAAVALSDALNISLPSSPDRSPTTSNLAGTWWCAWETSKDASLASHPPNGS